MKEKQFVNDYLSSDHRRLDLLFESLIHGIQEGKPLENQQSLFHLYKTGMLRHMHWEENILFPIVDDVVGLRSGPTRVLRAEHAELESMIRDIEKNMEEGFDLDYLLALGHIVDRHHESEEKTLYPVVDDLSRGDIQERIAIEISRGFK